MKNFVIRWVINGVPVYWGGKIGTHRRAWHVFPENALHMTVDEAVTLWHPLFDDNFHYTTRELEIIELHPSVCNL